ncbi:hypothetical protein D0864_15927 [Hortaea werneckii]|uniref:peptidyl-tRNA hydrolase n=1 Tax=Hortaea werneckii TaxID=91943 RepID=A0A3M7BTS6_HORWE|nr:hypothetical protein D0864_15927 [Hortaea werneckii]
MAIDEDSARAKRMPRLPQGPPKRTEIEQYESADTAQVAEDQASREEGGRKVIATGSGKRRKSSHDPPMTTTARTLPLLVCSIGNPGSTYANTLHSAGHTVVNSLAAHLGKEREFGNGLISRPAISGSTGDWTLWQSTSYMNESGKGLKAAFAAWSKHISVGEEGRVVVIYDELEKPLGSVTVRTNQGASARGHNGLKSILKLMRDVPFARIGIGIGRPVSRESNEVARYVLKKMTPPEKEKIDGSVEEVVKKLQQLERG